MTIWAHHFSRGSGEPSEVPGKGSTRHLHLSDSGAVPVLARAGRFSPEVCAAPESNFSDDER